MARVAVVGGGVAGLYVANLLARHHDVVVYEKARLAGWRKHCSGVVSVTTTRLLWAEDHVDNWFRRLVLRAGRLVVVAESRTPYACRIRREQHERYLAERLESLRARLHYNTWVRHVEARGDVRVVVEARGETRTLVFDYVVAAEGYPASIARSLGFNPYTETLWGLQARVRLGRRLDEETAETLYVHYNHDGSGGFTWLIPLSGREALVGAASRCRPLLRHVAYALKEYGRFVGKDARILEVYGGVLLRGYPRRLVADRAAALGDANTTVKSISCGGLAPIAWAAHEIAAYIDHGGAESQSIATAKTVRRLYQAYRLASRLVRLAEKLPRTTIYMRITSQDYDNHVTLLVKAMAKIEAIKL